MFTTSYVDCILVMTDCDKFWKSIFQKSDADIDNYLNLYIAMGGGGGGVWYTVWTSVCKVICNSTQIIDTWYWSVLLCLMWIMMMKMYK